MRYLNEIDCERISPSWSDTITVIEKAVSCMDTKDYAQPIKPYLKYREPDNRIIAMPAFLGGDFDVAGIKWIASFPRNHNLGLPRAHSSIILNDSHTGKPISFINGALLSIIRTASVSGLIIKKYLEAREDQSVKVGIIGFGPIGQYHLNMCEHLIGSKLDQVYLYDKKGIDPDKIKEVAPSCKVNIVDHWEDSYEEVDICITCTVASERYINKKPKQGSLLLNVSLRDYCTEAISLDEMVIVVDDWDEVARADTDIERLKDRYGLSREQCISIMEVVCHNYLKSVSRNQSVMFNPMGMSVFDVAIGHCFYEEAVKRGIGLILD